MRLLPNTERARDFYCNLILIFMVLMSLLVLFVSNSHAMGFKEYINSPIKTEETKNELRIEWRNVFGFDVFKSYFVVKDLEESFRNYTAINLGEFKGRLKFGESYKSIDYRFTYKF